MVPCSAGSSFWPPALLPAAGSEWLPQMVGSERELLHADTAV